MPTDWYRCDGRSDLEFGADGVSYVEEGVRIILGDPATGRYVIGGDALGDALFDPPAQMSWRGQNH